MSKITIRLLLAEATGRLGAAGIDSARLDSLLILEHVLGYDRSFLLAHDEQTVSSAKIIAIQKCIQQREQHVPMGYLLGHVEFYGHQFIVTPDTLIPRPESEAILDLLSSLSLEAQATIIDVGTGSGCLAISALLQDTSREIYAIDISPASLAVARRNAQQLQANVTFIQGDLLAHCPPLAPYGKAVVLANLPYVPTGFSVNRAAQHEPKLALYGGADGLALYRTLFRQLQTIPHKPFAIITESLATQHQELAKIAASSSYALHRKEGLAQLFLASD